MGCGPSDTRWPDVGTADRDLPGVDRVRQKPVQGGRTPAPIPSRRRDSQLEYVLGQAEQGPVRFQIAGQDFPDSGPFGRFDRHACRITGTIRRPTIAVGRNGPWHEDPCPACPLTPSAPTFGHQGAFIVGHGPADLSQETGLRVLPQRLIEKC